MHQRGREIQPAIHTAGETYHEIVAAVLQRDEAEQIRDPRFQLLARDVVKTAEKTEVFGCAQLRIKRVVLGCNSDQMTDYPPLVADLCPSTNASPPDGRRRVASIEIRVLFPRR